MRDSQTGHNPERSLRNGEINRMSEPSIGLGIFLLSMYYRCIFKLPNYENHISYSTSSKILDLPYHQTTREEVKKKTVKQKITPLVTMSPLDILINGSSRSLYNAGTPHFTGPYGLN